MGVFQHDNVPHWYKEELKERFGLRVANSKEILEEMKKKEKMTKMTKYSKLFS